MMEKQYVFMNNFMSELNRLYLCVHYYSLEELESDSGFSSLIADDPLFKFLVFLLSFVNFFNFSNAHLPRSMSMSVFLAL